jgi:hypothetical protein
VFLFLEQNLHQPREFQIVSFFEGFFSISYHVYYDYGQRRLQRFKWQKNFFGTHQICPTSASSWAIITVAWVFSTEYQIAVCDSNTIYIRNDNNDFNTQQIIPSALILTYKPSPVVFKGISLIPLNALFAFFNLFCFACRMEIRVIVFSQKEGVLKDF